MAAAFAALIDEGAEEETDDGRAGGDEDAVVFDSVEPLVGGVQCGYGPEEIRAFRLT